MIKLKKKKIKVRKTGKIDGSFKVCIEKFTFILLLLQWYILNS